MWWSCWLWFNTVLSVCICSRAVYLVLVVLSTTRELLFPVFSTRYSKDNYSCLMLSFQSVPECSQTLGNAWGWCWYEWGPLCWLLLLPVCATQLNLMSCRVGGSWGLPPPAGTGGTDTHPSEPPSWKMGLERVVEKWIFKLSWRLNLGKWFNGRQSSLFCC